MLLSPGESIGSYEILGPLGQGGMGEVYRARDSRLARDVALKVLRDGAASDTEGLARFQRETRAAAALNHSGILAIYDTGIHRGAPYAVTELLSGETLAERLEAGRLPPREAADVAASVANALAAAHAHGIVHRDIKPSNIFLTRDGQTKVLDFGIASFVPAASPGEDTAASTLGQTSGALVGTAGYVSPEQVRGRPADPRSDVFSLGATLFESLTGRKAFAGATPAETLSAVLSEDPASYPEAARIQPELRRIVLRSLDKDPANRYQSTRDLALDLQAWESGALAGIATAPAGRERRLPLVLGIVGGALLLGGGFFLGIRGRGAVPRASLGPVTRVALSLAPPLSVTTAERPLFAISPDGTKLVYCADVEGKRLLVLRDLDGLGTRVLFGTEGATGPFFSPDGQWVGFTGPGDLMKLSLAGGTPVALQHVPPVTRGASWASDDTIVYSPVNTGGFTRLSVSSGQQKRLIWPDYDHGEQAYRWPQLLPGGKAVLFTIYTGGDTFDAALAGAVRLDTGEKKILMRGGTSPHYSPTGHLVYAQGGSLLAAPFDLDRLEVTGAFTPFLSGVRTEATGVAQFAFSSNGTLVYLAGPSPNAMRYRLVRVDRTGRTGPLTPAGALYTPRFAPDGKRIAFSKGDANQDIWIADVERGTVTRLTPEASEEFDPVWSPDGKRIAYSSERRAASPEGFVRAADGSGEEEHLKNNAVLLFAQSWSPDGKTIAWATEKNGWDILTMELGQGAKIRPFLATPHSEAEPDFSPDGRWIAYTSNESGRFEVYARPFPGPGGKILISTDGGIEPVWSRDGQELFYRDGDRMMAVPLHLGAELSVGKPSVLFEKVGFFSMPSMETRQYDVAPDGKSFVMVQLAIEHGPAPEPVLVANWFAELERKLGGRR